MALIHIRVIYIQPAAVVDWICDGEHQWVTAPYIDLCAPVFTLKEAQKVFL